MSPKPMRPPRHRSGAGNYQRGIQIYEAILARYPFSDLSRQLQLDLMFAYYKAGMQEQAIEAADTFVRENPIHERVDYALYIKGLAYFEDEAGFLEKRFKRDVTQRPPKEVDRGVLLVSSSRRTLSCQPVLTGCRTAHGVFEEPPVRI